MNIVKYLKERGVTTQIRYYGTNDMASSFEVKNIIENYEAINKYLEKLKPNINNIDQYIDYLYLRCMSQYDEVIPLVKENLQELLTSEVSIFKQKYLEYQKKDLIKFVKNHYKEIFSTKHEGIYVDHDLVDFTIDFILTYCSSDAEMVEYVINNYSYQMYDRFDSIKRLFNKSEDLIYYDMLLSEENLKSNIIDRSQQLENVFKSLKEQNESKYNEKIKLFVSITKEREFNATIENVMIKYIELKRTTKMLENLKVSEANQFKDELKKQQKTLNKYLKERGNSIPFEINVKPLIDILKDEKQEWFVKAIVITHTHDKKDKKKMITNLEYSMKYFEKSCITDLVSTNIDTDNIFTCSTINNLDYTMMYGKFSMKCIIDDEKLLNDVMSYIIESVNGYFIKEKAHFNIEEFNLDINMLFNGIKEIKKSYKEKNDSKTKWALYGTEMLLCGLIEKILRNLYYEKAKDEQYVELDNQSIKSLLNTSEVRDIIGENNCNCLEYYLVKNKNRIGYNNRNNFAHYDDSIYDKLAYDTVLEELYLLMMISNTLLLKL